MASPTGAVRGARRHRFIVAVDQVELRLDQLVARNVPGLSRADARRILALGGVFVDRRRVKIASRLLRAGQVVEAWIGGALAKGHRGSAPTPMPVLVYCDDDVAVVEKPAGLVTAPTPEGDRGTLVDIVRRDLLGTTEALWVVHRLDRMTSGLLVFARSTRANRNLSELFRVHDVEREYLAVVRGVPRGLPRAIERPIRGRPAVTHVSLEESLGYRQAPSHDEVRTGAEASGAAAALVRARLETGRTHQIRIHLAHEGHPVMGDDEYGVRAERDRAADHPEATVAAQAPDHPEATVAAQAPVHPEATVAAQAPVGFGSRWPRPPRLALHATVLGFTHPATGAPLRFESPWPADLAMWLDRVRSSHDSSP